MVWLVLVDRVIILRYITVCMDLVVMEITMAVAVVVLLLLD